MLQKFSNAVFAQMAIKNNNMGIPELKSATRVPIYNVAVFLRKDK